MHFKQKNRGFTLIELLVAISILAIIAVLGWRGLDSIGRSRTALTAELEQTRALQLTFAQIESDCARLVNPLNYPNLPEGRSSWIDPQTLILIRNAYPDQLAPTLKIVTYRFKNGSLIRSESIGTRDIATLTQLLAEARNPPENGSANQLDIVMQTHLQSLEFAGYPLSSLVGSTNTAAAPLLSNKLAASSSTSEPATSSSDGNNQSPEIAVQVVDVSKVTTGVQISMQLENHEQNMLKIIVLGGA